MFYEDECGPFTNRFKVTGFKTSLKTITITENSPINFSLNDLKTDSVSFSELAINLNPITEAYQAQLHSKQAISFLPNAYACSPPHITSDETITDIQVFTDSDFNENYSSTDNIAQLFDFIVHYDGKGYQKHDLNEFLNTKPETPYQMILVLKTQPDSSKSLQFTIKYFQDGLELNQFEFTTASVVVL